MTGIEKLREFAKGCRLIGQNAYSNAIGDIADQIEREHAEDRESAAWVREHGGLDYVKMEWRSRVPHDRYEARRQRLLGHIAECETALGRRREIISKLNHRVSDLTRENAELRRRAMPEGMEWPRFEDGEKLTLDNAPIGVEGVEFPLDASGYALCCGVGPKRFRFCERVRRPAPKVYDADGAEIREGDRVWSTHLDEPHEWVVIDPHEDRDDSQTVLVSIGDRTGHARPEDLTHQRPVLDADGVEIRVGDTVWFVGGGEPAEVAYTITADASHPDEVVLKGYEDDWPVNADKLTHTKPEPPDSYCRLYADMAGRNGNARTPNGIDFGEFLRRCKALAERERGE